MGEEKLSVEFPHLPHFQSAGWIQKIVTIESDFFAMQYLHAFSLNVLSFLLFIPLYCDKNIKMKMKKSLIFQT